MEDVNLVVEGVKFMVLGMGTVLAFLIILIGAMIAQAKIITKYFPEPKASPVTPKQTSKNNNKIAAISAAITHHKNTNS